ncbi:glycosyltransferase family 2 protein [Ectobacillus ponti]|uniref:Glycosyltransferase family 2 protein n=1 Tax=Ectobacillus ponti TaxID=2961894 RepID=A0AA42BUJ9_9BACI|nr:glycosyltransferase family 2 protein [Ectobacillus ponti]MCP8970603.1 glycosyltransferase family 2 protein [Ectobacillus ponti]
MSQSIQYSIIIPVYNEEAVVRETYRRLTEVMEQLGEAYELLFVNDGSRDRTGELVEGMAKRDHRVKLLDFSRNFGHQIAITAGMDYARGDAVIIIDADLQDPPELIPDMIAKWREGYEVVYAKRAKRKGETLFKKWSAALFYRTLHAITEIDIPMDTGDFRLMDRRVCEAMRSIREKNRFVRGLVSWVGFRQTAIEYVRDERFAGETKYPLKKMLRFSMDGITSFSYKPLKLASYLGFFISFSSFLYLLVSLFQRLFTSHSVVAGWTSLIACVLLLNGVILILLGVIGEYIGRIYDETKDRPLYLLRNDPQAVQQELKVVSRQAE